MSAEVPRDDPGTLGRSQVVNRAPVRGSTWAAVARAVNYLNGMPRTLIPHSAVFATIQQGNSDSVAWRVFPSYQATHRLWMVHLEPTADDEALGTELEFTDPSGGTTIFRAGGGGATVTQAPFEHIETIASRTTSETTLTATFESIAGDHVVSTVACFELPRPSLALDANDNGLELGSFLGGHQIYAATGLSLGGIPSALIGALARGRRSLFAWARPATTAAAASTTSGTFSPFSPFACPALDRQLRPSETVATSSVRVYAWVSNGTTAGEVRFTAVSGDVETVAVPVTSTTPTWHSGSLDISVEDLSTADGWQSATADGITIEFRRSAGAGTLYVAGLSIHGRAS